MKVIEEWKPIKGFEGYYISNLGRVKSTRSFKGTKETILKGSFNQQGYKVITMMKDNKAYTKTLHRLLAIAFIPNLNNYCCINHKDGNKLNNNLNNLEWCSYSYNNTEAYRIGLKHSRIKPKKVKQYDKNNNLINIWNSVNEAGRQLSISDGNICECCNGNRRTAGNFIWRYVNEN